MLFRVGGDAALATRVNPGQRKASFVSYLDDYPFPYYIIVDNAEEVPEVISDALRQWFQMINAET